MNLKYKELNIDMIKNEFEELLNKMDDASYEESITLISKINQLREEFFSMYWISYFNYLLNVKDEYWNEQEKFFSKASPIIDQLRLRYYEKLLKSKHKEKLKEYLGNKVFQIAELETRLISDDIKDEEENMINLQNKYSHTITSIKVNFDNQEMPISKLNAYLLSEDRQVRIKAQKVKNGALENLEDEIDDIYDELIEIRNKIAKKLDFNNYAELSYIKMKRIGYDKNDIETFRNEVKKYVVPKVLELKEKQRKDLGVETLYYYDDAILFNDGNANPIIEEDNIKEELINSFKNASKPLAELFEKMVCENYLDIELKENKSSGAITSYIPTQKMPIFISTYRNIGSDVTSILHEFGHCFQLYSSRNLKYYENWWPTFDTCEIHSISMELLMVKYLKNIFGNDLEKYKYEKLFSSLENLCTICLVDEFQHYIYEEEYKSRESRKKLWRKLEREYLPWINYIDNDYLEKGNGYQKISHIVTSPFYYIDYGLSRIVSLQFYMRSLQKDNIWDFFINFSSQGGTYSYVELLERNNLLSPFKEGNIKEIIDNLEI